MRLLGHVPALDGLRGVAILAVLGYHFFGLPGGFFGVDVFFVLSGFLITTLLLEEHQRHGRISLRRFYRRRARRLLPALGALLLASAVFAWLGPATARNRIDGIAVTISYAANIYRLLGNALPLELSQNWSLSQEEQFYLLWPTILIVLLAWKLPLRRLAWLLLAAAASGVVWRLSVVAMDGASGRVFFGPDTRADGLLLGCALAASCASGLLTPAWLTRIARLAPAAAVVLLLLFALAGKGVVAFAAGFPLVEVCAATLVVACLRSRAALLEWRPLVWVGAISYSLYLWEGPAALFFHHTILGTAVTFLLGWFSYRFIEQPFRRAKAGVRDTGSSERTPGDLAADALQT